METYKIVIIVTLILGLSLGMVSGAISVHRDNIRATEFTNKEFRKLQLWGERELIVREIGRLEGQPTGQCVIFEKRLGRDLAFAGYEPIGCVPCDEKFKHNARFTIRVETPPPAHTQ